MWIFVWKEIPETSDNDTRWTIRSLILGTVKEILFIFSQKRPKPLWGLYAPY